MDESPARRPPEGVCRADEPAAADPPKAPAEDDLHLRAVINAVNEAVISLDGELRIVFFNQAAEKVFGYESRAVLGQAARAFPPLFDTLTQLISAYRSPRPDSVRPHAALQGQRANGQTFPMEASLTAWAAGQERFYTVVLRDVTLQKQRQQAITQSQKMLAIGALASGVAHDFNNILTAILSHLDLVATAPELPDTLKDNVAYAQTSARRGAELVSRLLTFSRQTEARLEPLNLYDLSAEVVAMLRRSIDRRILIRHELVTAPLWLVEGDSSQLMQMLMNLCINARDAMPNGGELRIRLENVYCRHPEAAPPRGPGEHVKLTISDTGEGMAPEVLSRLFEPYFTTKAVGKGTGLGLSIAYGVVTEHGGWMEVESKQGVGSQFHAYFPKAQTRVHESPQAAAQLAAADSAALEGSERILVVDDDEMVRLVMRAVLSYRGYHVAEATDGEQAVRMYREAAPRFDLVILDLNMPRMNGWDAMAQIRAHDPAAVIILLSGGLTGGEVERALSAGARDLLTKPFENPELLRLARRTLDEAKAEKPPAPPAAAQPTPAAPPS